MIADAARAARVDHLSRRAGKGQARPGRLLPMSTVPSARRSRSLGALLGLAVGDAVGTTLEFRRSGTFEPITDMVGGGPFGLKAGQWTDDTSMALCLAESLVACRGFDARDQMERYVRWRRDGHLSSTGTCFDIGNTVAAALSRFEETGEPFAGSADPHAAGNGSLMRLAPVPIAFAGDGSPAALAEVERLSAESSRTTHGAAEAVDACRVMGRLIAVAIAHEEVARDALLVEAPAVLGVSPTIATIAAGSYRAKRPPAIRGTGYVVDCLEAALWAFDSTDDFRTCILAAANLGHDADTTAAIAGQLAGAFYGAGGNPPAWLDTLALREQIEELAAGLIGMNA